MLHNVIATVDVSDFEPYNDSKKIRNVYSDYKIIPLKWGYVMKNVSKNNEGKKSMKKSSEVLILSHEISKYHEKK